jgi:hypothetical protein
MHEAREQGHHWLWIGLLGGSSIGFSLVFACATPFVALVALATTLMARRDAFMVTGSVWLANQAVGYGILGYPHTLDSYAWGLAIGAAVVLALLAAQSLSRYLATWPVVARTAAAFGLAFAVYELALYVSSFWLSSSDTAFSWRIVLYILQVNVLGLAALVALAFCAVLLGLRPTRSLVAVAADGRRQIG